jgi:hypothetical protein
MSFYSPTGDPWPSSDAPPDPPYIHIPEDAPTIAFVGPTDTPNRVTGAPPRATADTIHTVVGIDPELRSGTPLCAVYVDGQDLSVDDLRPEAAAPTYDGAVDQLRSALREILIPVYIDDAIEEVSESVEGLLALHTAQYEGPESACSYFRTSVFRDGSLLLEEEWGAL